MTDEHPKDPLALGLGSLAAGVGFGGACLTAVQIAASIVRGDLAPSIYRDPLIVGLFAAIAVAAVCGWYRSAALENIWQRGVIIVLAVVGALMIGFLAAPLDRFFGVLGMIVWLAITLAFGFVGTRWAIRGKGEEGSGTGTA